MTTENTVPRTLSIKALKIDRNLISSVEYKTITNGLGMHSHIQVTVKAISADAKDTEILIYPHEYDSIEEYNTLVKQRARTGEKLMIDAIRHAALMRKQCDLFVPDL